MSELDVGDTVVFMQKPPDGYAKEKAHDVFIKDGNAYLVHRGDVREYIEGSEPTVRVAWDDGAHTTMLADRLDQPDDVEWYDG